MVQSTQTYNFDDPQVATQATNMTKAIFQTESGTDYNAKGASGENGAGQWMPATWQAQAQDVLGDANAPMTPENQSVVAQGTIRKLISQGKNAADIAAIWNSGSDQNWQNKISIGYGGTMPPNSAGVQFDVPKYVKSVTDAYQTIKNGGSAGVDSSNPSSTANTTNTPPAPYGALNPASKNDDLGTGLLKMLENIPSSGWNLAKNLGSAILNPGKTIGNVINVGAGALEEGENALGIAGAGGNFNNTQTQAFDKMKSFIGSRYGSIDNFRNTIENDPIGVLMDASTVLSGVGAGVSAASGASDLADAAGLTSGMNASDAANMTAEAARTGELGTAANVGQKISDVGSAINPVGLATKGLGATISTLGKASIGINDIMEKAQQFGIVGNTLAGTATALVGKLLGLGWGYDIIAGMLEPQVAKLVDWASLGIGKGLMGAGGAISKTAPIVGTVGNVANVANKGLLSR